MIHVVLLCDAYTHTQLASNVTLLNLMNHRFDVTLSPHTIYTEQQRCVPTAQAPDCGSLTCSKGEACTPYQFFYDPAGDSYDDEYYNCCPTSQVCGAGDDATCCPLTTTCDAKSGTCIAVSCVLCVVIAATRASHTCTQHTVQMSTVHSRQIVCRSDTKLLPLLYAVLTTYVLAQLIDCVMLVYLIFTLLCRLFLRRVLQASFGLIFSMMLRRTTLS
jgi:hypothetical protein